MKKNIIIIEDSSKAKFGGGQKVTLEVMKGLEEYYSLYLVDCKKESIFKQKSLNHVKEIIEINCFGKIKGGSKSSLSLGISEIIITPLNMIKNIFYLKSMFNDKQINKKNTIIYATTKKALLVTFMLNKFTKIEYIFHSHSFDDRNSNFYPLINHTLKNAKKIICVSDYIKNNIDLPNTITVYNPVFDISNTHKNIKNKDKIIVASFSTLIKWKGIEYFMNSYSSLKNKDKVEFWIFGDGEELKSLREFENNKVILKGFTNNAEDLMKNNIDIIVVPSISSEACPMVPLEAFTYGIPVISTNIGGQNEIVVDKKVGLKVDIKSSEQIAEKIDFLIDNPDKYEEYSKNALNYANKFLIDEYNKKINKIFKEV